MEQVDFTIKRYGDSYHVERWWGEAKWLNSQDDSEPVVERIERRVRPDGDESDTRIWSAARHVFNWACRYAMSKVSASGDAHSTNEPTGHPHFADDSSVKVERYPDPSDGQDWAVIQLCLQVFVGGVERVVDCDVEPRFNLGAQQPDSQLCDAITLLADWMVEETARQMKTSQSS